LISPVVFEGGALYPLLDSVPLNLRPSSSSSSSSSSSIIETLKGVNLSSLKELGRAVGLLGRDLPEFVEIMSAPAQKIKTSHFPFSLSLSSFNSLRL